jgi:hypothetical protein
LQLCPSQWNQLPRPDAADAAAVTAADPIRVELPQRQIISAWVRGWMEFSSGIAPSDVPLRQRCL